MMFQNPEIALDAMPGTDAVQWQALDPAYKRLRQLQNALILFIIAVPLTILTVATDVPLLRAAIFWGFWTSAAVIVLSWPRVSLPKRGYVVRDKDILFKKGVVWRSVTAIPFNRIQHVETSSTPFDRKFDLATLQLFTAGGSSGDLTVDGLATDTAEQLRAFILAKAGASIEHA